MTDALHYLSLSLTNIRAFGGKQTLDLSKNGAASRWCLVIGENGVGKTTLLQALAALRPVPSFANNEERQKLNAEASQPSWTAPALADYENERIVKLVRKGVDAAALESEIADEAGAMFRIGFDIEMNDGELKSAEPLKAERPLRESGPLVIAYSAFRQVGRKNMAAVENVEPTEALFDESIELLDPDEFAARLDYLVLDAQRKKDETDAARYRGMMRKMVEVVAALIPDMTPDQILIEGAGGIRIETPSGRVPLADLSLGAQTTVAWVADLVWRLHVHFRDSAEPSGESAIVLIDEVELHLHPKWQRTLRGTLLGHFPRVQFIVTTHSPITAQESVSMGDPISIVSWEGAHSVIRPDPFPEASVRLDDVATGIFELETSLARRFEALLSERRDLIRRASLDSRGKYRLASLNRVARAVQGGLPVSEADLEAMMAAGEPAEAAAHP